MTSLVRRNPTQPMDQLFDRFQRLMAEAPLWPFTAGFGTEAMSFADWTPAVDIQETDEAWLVHAELPSVRKEDVKVTLEDGSLVLAGERRAEKEDTGKRYHRIERRFGRFERSFMLPGPVEEGRVTAKYEDGVLHITLPKAAKNKPATKEVKIG